MSLKGSYVGALSCGFSSLDEFDVGISPTVVALPFGFYFKLCYGEA